MLSNSFSVMHLTTPSGEPYQLYEVAPGHWVNPEGDPGVMTQDAINVVRKGDISQDGGQGLSLTELKQVIQHAESELKDGKNIQENLALTTAGYFMLFRFEYLAGKDHLLTEADLYRVASKAGNSTEISAPEEVPLSAIDLDATDCV